MKIQFHFRKIDPSLALQTLAEEACTRLSQQLINESSWQVTFSAVKHQKRTHIEVQCSWGRFQATGTEESFPFALTLATEKLEKQLMKEKSKLQDHKKKELTRPKQAERHLRLVNFDEDEFEDGKKAV